MNKLIIILIAVLLFSSCKKDKLEGDKEILVGKWKWIYTVNQYSKCDPPTIVDTLTPLTQNKEFSIEFFKKGQVMFDTDKKQRIVFDVWNSYDPPLGNLEYRFAIRINNDIDKIFDGWVSPDTLILSGKYTDEPYFHTNSDGCTSYMNYYVKYN